ncbi:septum formation family protein [Polymorphospora rubra]|uniref:Septum formation-related domain-containing protein n=1 Tax=Polymorphospora rubra TaxID=338584 RepID=A0A810N2R0_9ACTN|nr:septum formation family protein [Polymorphospora rubra]BCJ65988.1 hypothetical protein Prubr_30090 [Polymorphospora rubra]
MRRWLTAVAVAGTATLLLTGCGNPAGVDGNLVNGWAAFPEPKAFVPAAEVCHTADFAETAYLSSYSPVDCATSHRVETIFVGTLTGATAEANKPPTASSTDIKPAYTECDTKAKEFVGADWRTGRLWLGVAVPSPQAWSGGARWFRCDLTEESTVENDGDSETVNRTASLRDALKTTSPLNLGCYAVKLNSEDRVDTMDPVECTKEHNSEFVGVWTAPDGNYPSKDTDWDKFYSECRTLVGRYVGVPLDNNLRYRTGVIALPNGQTEWQAGNRGVRCYLWMADKKFTRSLKGTGNNGLPIQYQ